MALRKSTPAKRQRSSSTSWEEPPPLEDPHRFISREAERIYHESLFNRSFLREHDFPTSNAFFNFTIQKRRWQTLCAPPVPRVAPVVREFHSNLPFKMCTTVFVRGRWVEFGAQAINQIYRMIDDESAEYRALFANTDYERLMQELTHGQGVWRHHPSTGDFTTFHMHSLTPVAKVWYNFLYVKIKPSLHLSTVTKDRATLLYAMTKGFQCDIGYFIEQGLIESTQGRCTGALIHPSLITQLCRLVEVPMLDFEEQVQQRLPIPLPKAKFGSPSDSKEETDEDAPAATPSTGDPEDGDPEVTSSST